MKEKQQGLVGFLIKKRIVYTKSQAYMLLLSLAVVFYALSGLIFYSFYSQSKRDANLIARYQLIDQSKFK